MPPKKQPTKKQPTKKTSRGGSGNEREIYTLQKYPTTDKIEIQDIKVLSHLNGSNSQGIVAFQQDGIVLIGKGYLLSHIFQNHSSNIDNPLYEILNTLEI